MQTFLKTGATNQLAYFQLRIYRMVMVIVRIAQCSVQLLSVRRTVAT